MWRPPISVAYTPTGASVKIDFAFVMGGYAGSNPCEVDFKVYRGTTEIFSVADQEVPYSSGDPAYFFTYSLIDTPAAGSSVTYYVKAQSGAVSDQVYTTRRLLAITGSN